MSGPRVAWAVVPSVLALVAATAAAAPSRDALGRSTKPKPSRPPAAPAIADGVHTFIAFAGAPAPVKLSWSAAPDVARYRARWTDAGANIDVELPGTATAFERAVATPGLHRLTVIAIDAEGRESPPADVAVEVVTVTAYAPGSDEPEYPASNAFAVGSKFASPGLTCQLGDNPRAAEVTATLAGATTLHCGGEAGQPRVEAPVVIAPVVIAGPTRPLVRGVPTQIHVTVASVAPLGEKLVVEAFGDLELGDADRSEHGFDVPVTARTAGGLIVRAGTVELGRVELAVSAPPSVVETSGERSEWYALDLGAQLGVFVPATGGLGSTALGQPTTVDDTLNSAPTLGARIGFFPTRRAGLEVEAALGAPGYERQSGHAMLAIARAHIAARLVDEDRLGLRLLAGVDLLGLVTSHGSSARDAEGAVHYGAAITVEARPDLWVRLEALHVVTPALDAGYAHCAEVQIGLVTRLGRRDRW